jgi:hypothetical protein
VLVQDRKRLSGPGDHGTLVARRDLAIWTGNAGNAASPRDQLQKLLPTRIRNYGSDHQDTLYERDCLAEWTGKAGDPRAAADQFAQLLEIHKTRVRREQRQDQCYSSQARGMAHGSGQQLLTDTGFATMLDLVLRRLKSATDT